MAENNDNTAKPKSPLGDLGVELRSEEFQEVLGKVPPWILRWGITVLAFVVVILLIGSAIIKYPDIIPAQVVLTGSTPPAAIAARSSGKIKELYVKDKQNVMQGDYLAVIDNPAETKDILFLKNYLDTLTNHPCTVHPVPSTQLQLGNLQSLYSSFYTNLFNYQEYKRLLYFSQKRKITEERIVQYEKQYQNLLRQQAIQSEQLQIVKTQFHRDSTLNRNGIIAHEELERSKSQYLQSLLSYETMFSTIRSMQIQITQLKESLLDNNQQDTETVNNLQTQIQSLTSQLETEIQAWELSYVLVAPIGGTITFTDYWIENQNVQSGAEVFTILPQGDYRIIGKAMLPVARSGKVETGQKVNIRLVNFPENEFGILRGKVENISLVPVINGDATYYTVEIVLPNGLQTTYKKELPWLPNMQGQAEVITEDISLLERFILPIKKILRESL